MTYGQLKKRVMQLAFSESIAGTEIPATYNNQADYLRMIPGLANDGMMYIATTVKKIPEIVPLSSLEKEDLGAYSLYILPNDFYQLMNGGLIWQRPDFWLDNRRYSYQRFHDYKLYGRNKLMISNRAPNLDGMMVEYYRFPSQIDESKALSNGLDNVELDNTPDTHEALPYHIAAEVVKYDDPFRYSSLHNEFETRLARLTEPVTTEFAPVEDVYAGFNFPGVY